MFGKLRVWDTEHNNGVLIYLLLAEHAIEIVADRGLARHVPQAQWDALLAGMQSAFRAGRFEEGLAQAIDAVHALLLQHFPLAEGQANPNELAGPRGPALKPAHQASARGLSGPLKRSFSGSCPSGAKSRVVSGTSRSGKACSRWRIRARRPRRWSLKSTSVQGACVVWVALSITCRAWV